MGSTTTRPTNFVPGADYPSPVTHVIGFGYYDGVTDGVLKTADGSVYRFEMTDEESNPDGPDRRTFDLAPLPDEAFDSIVAAIQSHISPLWPCWVPLWKFPSEDARKAVEERIDRVLAAAGKPAWRVKTQDLTGVVSATAIE